MLSVFDPLLKLLGIHIDDKPKSESESISKSNVKEKPSMHMTDTALTAAEALPQTNDMTSVRTTGDIIIKWLDDNTL
jgi:hypothetical protein